MFSPKPGPQHCRVGQLSFKWPMSVISNLLTRLTSTDITLLANGTEEIDKSFKVPQRIEGIPKSGNKNQPISTSDSCPPPPIS